MRNTLKLLFGISAVILLSASNCTDTANKIADAAPPARTPILKSTDRLFGWSGDPNFYLSTGSFEATVRAETNLLNHITISVAGTPLPEFDGNDPANGSHIVYTVKDLASPSGSDFILHEYRLFYPTAIGSRLVHGTRTEFQFVETSINPRYSSTPSSPLSVPVMTWDRQCLVEAEIDNPLHVGETKELRIKGHGCKRIQVDINANAFQTLEATGSSTEIDTKLNINIRTDLFRNNPSNGQRMIEFKMTGTNPIMKSLRSFVYGWEQPVTPCPISSSNPSGQLVWYPYCVARPSTQFAWFVSDGVQQACSRDEATAIVQNENSDCSVGLDPNSKCSVSPDLSSQFAVCTQCTGQPARRDPVGACTQTQAVEMVRALADKSCTVSACP